MTSRLLHALESGALSLPDGGRIVVFGGGADETLFALDRDLTQIVQPFFPDHRAIRDAGYHAVLEPDGAFDAALIRLPRSREAGRAAIAAARSTTDGPIVVDGAKTDGVEAVLKECRARARITPPVSKGHGKIFSIEGGDFADWTAKSQLVDGYITRPGVFSADGVDPGSRLLTDALPDTLAGRVADFGAGWGYLAHAVLRSAKVTSLDLIEADAVALECARENVDDARVSFHWGDATQLSADGPYDAIVMNPPFHAGRAGDTDLGRAFIRSAAAHLVRHGTLWLVANRHLPYEAGLAEVFAEVEERGGDPRYKIFRAAQPRQKKRS